MKDTDKDTNLQACLAARHLFESSRCRNQFMELLGIPVLLDLGKTDEIEVKREVAAIVALPLTKPSFSSQCPSSWVSCPHSSVQQSGGVTLGISSV